jgi:hypothetical protein
MDFAFSVSNGSGFEAGLGDMLGVIHERDAP